MSKNGGIKKPEQITAIISLVLGVVTLAVAILATLPAVSSFFFITPTPGPISASLATHTPTPTSTLVATHTPTPTSTLVATHTPTSTLTYIPGSLPTQVASLQNEVVAMQQELDELNRILDSHQNPSADLATLHENLNSLDTRLSVIEQAVLDNPGRALQLTLLAYDMENLKSTIQADLENTRGEIGRVYTFNFWFLGAIITLSLAVISIAVTNFLKRSQKLESAETNGNASQDT